MKYSSFTPSKLTIAGVIANRVGSQKHAESINHALAAINIPLIGTVRTDVEGLPTRHVGLYMGAEASSTPRALKLIYDSLDIEFIKRAATPITVEPQQQELNNTSDTPVSYTHLTLPT